MRKFRILCISLLVVFFAGMAQRLVVDSLYGYRMGEGIARHSMSRDLVEDTHVSLDVKLDEFSRIEPNAVNGFTGDSVIVIPERVSVAAFAEAGSAGCRSDMVLGIVSGILNFLLLGILLAVVKRFYSRMFGMKKTTRQRPYDLVILTTLWLIFPARFIAESFTSGANGGGSFLTHGAGEVFASFLPVEHLSYGAWWVYSSLLGLFFLLLPFSRYMHIPTEMVFIFLKNWGVQQRKTYNTFSEVQVNACSRCGICINTCQLNTSCNINDTQPVYFLRRLRNGEPYAAQAEDCLLCGPEHRSVGDGSGKEPHKVGKGYV